MYSVSINNTAFKVEKTATKLTINESILEWNLSKVSDRHYHVLYNNCSYNLEIIGIDYATKTVRLKLNNKPAVLQLKDKMDLLLEKLGMGNSQLVTLKEIKAPMPGLIVEIKVKEGDEIKKGDPILVLEAMKMENIIKSSGDAIVKTIKIKKGDSVEKNQVLIQF
jgi:acetyl/propionyl-CoA carboxylase alpha subunit